MAEIHYFICDQCGHHEAVAQGSSRSLGYYYERPKNWTTVSYFEVCSIECAKDKADTLNGVPKETPHCKCRGCK